MRFTLLLLILLTQLPAFAQQNITLRGATVDSRGEPLIYTEIGLYTTEDTTAVMEVLADEKGAFELAPKPGSYLLMVKYFGFKDYYKLINITDQHVDLGKLTLEDTFDELEGVSLEAQKDVMEFKMDKRIYNVGSDISNIGTNASEMLENIPSVAVDAEGNVSLRGNQSVRILIDGKYSGFASTADALKQLQTDRIEKVEIITNASARYDAEGDAGIINIVLKKDRKDGLNGSVNLRTGYNPMYGGGFNFNYRKNKFNYYIGFNINKDQSPATSTTYQRLRSEDTSFTYRQLYNHERNKYRNDGTFGVDYDINDQNTLSASFNFRSGIGNNFYDRVYENLDDNDQVLSRDTRLEDNEELEDLLEGTLSFRRKLNKKGGEWNTEFKIFRDQDFERSDFTETSTGYTEVKKERSNAFVTEQYALLQSDYIYPIGNDGKVEMGFRSQWRNMNNDFGFSRQVGNEWETPAQFNDNFDYDEKVHAAYLMGANTYGKLGMQVGLRAELSDITTTQASESEANRKNYLNFFPSAAFSYKLSDASTLQLSYSRRIRRPGQWDLMPFMKFGDNREMRVGNPDINPELTNSLEAGWMQYFKNGSLLSSVYYKKTTDKIERLAMVGTDGIIYRVPMNISDRDAMGLELNGNYSPKNWLRFTTGFNFFREVVSGVYEGQSFNVDNLSWSNRTALNITFPYEVKFQISANYRAPSVNPQGRSLAIFHSDAGISKDFWKKNATIAFNVRDIFNSRRWKRETNTETIYAISDFQWRPRSFRLTFTYRFNQSRKDAKSQVYEVQDMEE